MSVKDRTTLLNEINTFIDSNGNNGITASELRARLIDIVDSYSNLTNDAGLLGLRPYDPTKVYQLDQTCIFNNQLYICLTTGSTGTFNPANWALTGTSNVSNPFNGNRFQTPLSVTTNSGYTGLTLTSDPPANCRIDVFVNGEFLEIGDGSKLKNFYLSGDNGATARTFANTTAGDKLYFNAVITGWNLETTDKVSINYNS